MARPIKELMIEPTGHLSHKTITAIHAYRRHRNWRVVRVDGMIHPAKHEKRRVSVSGKHLMTTALMHFDRGLAEETKVDYTMLRRFANLGAWIGLRRSVQNRRRIFTQ